MRRPAPELFGALIVFFLLPSLIFCQMGHPGTGGAGVPSQQRRDSLKQMQNPPAGNDVLTIFEKSFKPSAYDTDVPLKTKNGGDTSRGIAPPQVSIPPQGGFQPDTSKGSLGFAIAQPETVQGYRVQVVATNSFDEAMSARNLLNSALPDLWVYMVYDAPTYKVRVGNFLNRADANLSLDSLVAMGYKEAWIVPDKIIKNPPPKPSTLSPPDSLQTKK
ncbi:MAG: SPOR domain-containing protein [Bacteroidota bacterium]|nr:SPOR domain-containing protein [Bacteroidota bacterium]